MISRTCSTKKRSRRSADILQEVRSAQVLQSPWPLPWIPHPSGDGQIVLHKLLPDAADPPRRHRFIRTTCVKIQHTAQLADGLALELGEVNIKTLPMLRRTRRTFHRHTGGGPTSSGMSQAFARAAHSLAENLPPSVSTCPGHRECRNHRRKTRGAPHICRHASVAPTPSLASSLSSLSGEDVAATWTRGGQKARTRRARVKKTPMDLELADTCSSLFRQSHNTHVKA